MARVGLFFRGLDRINRAGVPGNALRAQAAWACLLVLSGSYSDLLKYVISADLLFFVLLVLAVVVLRRRRPEWPRPFRLPGGALLPLLYAAGGGALILLLLSANPRTTWPGYLIVGAGVPVYALWRRRGAGAGATRA
jgi:APA family basic amino acid/polyamine antiporter